MKNVLLIPIGLAALVLGIAGLIIPIIPGFIFLALAAICFATVVPGLRRKLERNSRMQRLFNRVDRSTHYPALTRLKLLFWACLETVMPIKRP